MNNHQKIFISAMHRYSIAIFCTVVIFAVSSFFICNNDELKSWYEWHCMYSSTRELFKREKYNITRKNTLKDLIEFLDFCEASYDDRIDRKESNLRTAKLLAEKLCNNRELKEALLEEGRYETMLRFHENLLADRKRTQELKKLLEWRLKKIGEYAKTGKMSVLCQDEDYTEKLIKINASFLLNLTPPTMTESDRQVLLERVRNSRESFIEMEMKNITGDGMSEESPLDLRDMKRYAIYGLIHYAHLVCNSSIIGLQTSYSQVDDICEALLYDKTSKKTFTLYFLIDSKVLMDYIAL